MIYDFQRGAIMKPLVKSTRFTPRSGPLVLVIMDGIGIGDGGKGDAVSLANTPILDSLRENSLYTTLQAHGTAVGLPSDRDMGNSEVGHNALGAGRIYDQGAKLVNSAIASGKIFETKLWARVINRPRNEGKTLHFIGLLSDGNVHSHIDHLFALIEQASSQDIEKLRVHTLLDGRDVHETSALIYINKLEEYLEHYRDLGRDYRIASGGGRMVTTMDRYEADWDIVKRGWEAHVLGTARPFSSAQEAIETFRKEEPDITDQYLPSFTIVDEHGPVGPIVDGDSVILFNFRGDRAIEICRAFEERHFDQFDRQRFPAVLFAGMMEYDGDLNIPKNYLVYPPHIDHTVSEYLVHANCRQFAISETQKFGHVTYFWNGNRSGKFDGRFETYEEIPSDRIEFDKRPWMKAADITDRVIRVISTSDYDFIRLNYPNGDMVGHTGNLEAAIIAAEVVDLCLGRLLVKIRERKSIAVITADHGNSEEMFETDRKGKIKIDPKTGERLVKTSHSLNPVPFIIYDPQYNHEYRLAKLDKTPGLANVASTLLLLLGYEPPDEYLPPIITL
jgi:2,3-bisphosphoglycerate-independent phosphoglycerate mutase